MVPVAYVLLLCVPPLLRGDGRVLGSESGDLFLQFVGQREFGFGEIARGHLPLWNPRIFSGMPALGNIQFALCYPPNLLFLFLPLAWAFNASIMLHLSLAGICMGWWVRSRGAPLLPALVAGILYLGCGAQFSRVLAGHQTMICLLPWAPLLFWAVDAVAADARPGPALAGAAATAMMLLAGYPQFVFHIGAAAGLYAVLRLTEVAAKGRKALLLALIPLLAAGMTAFQLAATAQASAGSLRSGKVPFEYAAMFSLPLENLLTLVSPFVWGGAGGEGYWGRWYLWETQLFFGCTGLVAALLALGRKADHDRWPILGVALLMVLLALGDTTPLFRVLYDHVPPFGHFRGASKWALPASLFLVLLAARGFQSLLEEPERRQALPWVLAAAAVATGALAGLGWNASETAAPAWWRAFVAAVAGSRQSYELGPDLAASGEFLRSTLGAASRALAVAAVTFAAMAVLAAVARRRRGFAPALLVLAVVEVFCFDRAYLATFPIEGARRPDVAGALRGDSGDYRVHVADHPDSAMSTGARDIWGYDPFVPRRYAEFVAFSQDAPLDTPAVDIPLQRLDPLLALLRLRYVVSPAAAGGLDVAGPFPHLPRALPVPGYAVAAPSREAILAALRQPGFDPYRTVVLEEAPVFPAGSPPHAGDGHGTARAVSASTDEVVVEAESNGPTLLLLTDPFSPGWRATALPGSSQAEYRILRADYVLQAIPLGRGTHRIRLQYAPRGLGFWAAVSLCTTIGVAAAGFVLRRRGRRRPPAGQPGAPATFR